MKNATIRIPQRFFDDHEERDLPAPEVVKWNKKHYWIDANSEYLYELLSDASHYATSFDFEFGSRLWGLSVSAAATEKAIRKHLDEITSDDFVDWHANKLKESKRECV